MSDDLRTKTALERIFEDDRLKRFRTKLSFDELRIVLGHAKEANSEASNVGTRIAALEATARECLGWIRHWQADVAGNLKPTPDSLAMMEAKLVAILQPVEASEAAE